MTLAARAPAPLVEPGTAQPLKRIFLLALAARVLVAIILHFGVGPEVFAPDQQTYDAFGHLIADGWASETPGLPRVLLRPGPKGYIYLVASLYYVIGHYALVPKLVNCILGALSTLLVYDVARRMGAADSAALRATRYAAFFPSLVLWSTLNIRDVWIIVLILLICRQALVLQARPSAMALLTLAGALFGLVQFRAYVLYAVAGPVVVSLVVQRSRNLPRNLILGGIAASAIIYVDQSASATRRVNLLDFEQINEIRRGNTQDAASSFDAVDISTPAKAAAFLPKGLVYFLLAPFPWMLGSVRQVLAVPEMLFFYSLLPSMFRGVRHFLRRHLQTSLIAVLIAGGLTLGYALGEGNAGTAYRHRAQILCFFLVFAAVGKDPDVRREVSFPPIRAQGR